MSEPSILSNKEDDKEQKIYLTLSLAKYPFLKNQKVGSKGEAKFKGEIEKSDTQDDDDCVHHTIAFQDLVNAKAGGRV